jgi:hypothetical protein
VSISGPETPPTRRVHRTDLGRARTSSPRPHQPAARGQQFGVPTTSRSTSWPACRALHDADDNILAYDFRNHGMSGQGLAASAGDAPPPGRRPRRRRRCARASRSTLSSATAT